MLMAIDVETRGLDCTKYLTGCIIKEGKKTPEIYRNKKELWNQIIKTGITCAKKGRILNVYSHNAQYDTAAYANLKDKNLIFFSNSPFIWAYKLDKKECDELGIRCPGKYKEIIKFLDTFAIFRMSLKKVGELIGLTKFETPLETLEKEDITEFEMARIEEYMAKRDRD